MGKHFLEDFVAELEASGETPLNCGIGKAWYNPYGDCIEYRSMEGAYFGDRIDQFLTIYRCVETEKPIGFMVKGIIALIDILVGDSLAIDAKVDGEGVVSVKVNVLLFAAFTKGETLTDYHRDDDKVTRFQKYAQAMSATNNEEVQVPAQAAA